VRRQEAWKVREIKNKKLFYDNYREGGSEKMFLRINAKICGGRYK